VTPRAGLDWFPMLTGDADRSWIGRPGLDRSARSSADASVAERSTTSTGQVFAEGRVLYCPIYDPAEADRLTQHVHGARESQRRTRRRRHSSSICDSTAAATVIFNKRILAPLIKSKYDAPGPSICTDRPAHWSARRCSLPSCRIHDCYFCREATA